MDLDVSWTIDGILVDGWFGDEVPTFERGREITIEVDIDGEDSPTGDPFVLGSDDGTALGGADGGTLSGESSLPDRRYRALKRYIEHVGTVEAGRTIGGEVFVREYLTDQARVDSKVVPFDPGDDVDYFPAFWGAIVGGEDRTTVPGFTSIEFDVVVLAKRHEYATRAALLADLESPVNQL